MISAAVGLACCTPASSGTPPTPRAETTAIPTVRAGPLLGCTTLETSPTPNAASAIAPISDADFFEGPTGAPVTLLAYCDFQSPECEIFNRVLDELVKSHPGELRAVYRLVPVPISVVASLDKSELSAQAAIAAGEQDRFWEMRQLLHESYNDWVGLAPPEFEAWVREKASLFGLNEEQFNSDLDSSTTRARVQEAFQAATALGINNIPTVFINGQLQPRAAMSYAGLQSTIGLIALGSRQYRECPPLEIDPALRYIATIRTERGLIVIRLFADRAPLAVNSFVFLARRGWFDGTTFHRVIPGFAAQAGDPSSTGQGGPGYLFRNEILADLRFDRPGVVALANSGPDTNGSQFFITYAPQPQLDGSYTIFGEVIEGMEVVGSLTPRDPQSGDVLSEGDKIETVEIQAQ